MLPIKPTYRLNIYNCLSYCMLNDIWSILFLNTGINNQVTKLFSKTTFQQQNKSHITDNIRDNEQCVAIFFDAC